MPHDPALVEDTRSWLTRASRDLRAAEHDLRATPPLSWDAVFHCQQAAEKALKAFLAWHDEPFGKTHKPPPSILRFGPWPMVLAG